MGGAQELFFFPFLVSSRCGVWELASMEVYWWQKIWTSTKQIWALLNLQVNIWEAQINRTNFLTNHQYYLCLRENIIVSKKDKQEELCWYIWGGNMNTFYSMIPEGTLQLRAEYDLEVKSHPSFIFQNKSWGNGNGNN